MPRILSNRSAVTVFEGPSDDKVVVTAKDMVFTKTRKPIKIDGIGALRVRQTVKIYEILSRYGIPTAFIEQIDDHSILFRKCAILPLIMMARTWPDRGWEKRHSYPYPDYYAFGKKNEPVEIFCDGAVVIKKGRPIKIISLSDAYALYYENKRWEEGVFPRPIVYGIDEEKWELWPSDRYKEKGFCLFNPWPFFDSGDYARLKHVLLKQALGLLWNACRAVEADPPMVLGSLKLKAGRDAKKKIRIAGMIDCRDMGMGGSANGFIGEKHSFPDDPIGSLLANYEEATDFLDQIDVGSNIFKQAGYKIQDA